MNSYTAIYFFGPRLSGKSTLGKLVSEKLGLKFVDMDELITQETGKTVTVLTENGTNWQAFRNIELALVKTLLREKNIVVSCGGGIGVNNIIKQGTNETYGELEMELLKNAPDVFKVVLLPNKSAFTGRVRNDENVLSDTRRPLLDEKLAEKIETALFTTADVKMKNKILVNEKIKSTLLSYDQRKESYEALADLIIDTGSTSIEKSVEEVLRNYKVKK